MTTPRRPNANLQDKVVLTRDVTTAISATTTQLLGTMTRDYLIDRFELEVPGGYSADASNYYVITLRPARPSWRRGRRRPGSRER